MRALSRPKLRSDLLTLVLALAAPLAGCSEDGAAASAGGTQGAAGGGAGGGAATGGGAGQGGALPVSELSDDFEGAALDPSWSQLGPELVDIVVEGGQLAVTMTQQALWFHGATGFLLHKRAAGDFKATAVVRARRASDPAAPADAFVHLGGIMARHPEPQNGEDYVFIVVGRDEQDLSVETKTTDDGTSTYDGPAWPSGDAELRLCRVGSVFVLLKRAIGDAAWIEAAEHDRGDLPDPLDVGINVYSGATPDLRVLVDAIDFEPVASIGDCAAD